MANGWGGRRNGSGRKPPGSNVVQLKPKKDQRPQPMFSDESVMAIIEATREMKARSRNRPRTPLWNPYIIRPDLFGPVSRHITKHQPKMAMDQNSALQDANMMAVQAWQAGGLAGNDAAEGLLFLGYPFLSEMAQRAEFRLFGEIMSEEMTRKFIDFRGTDDESLKSDKDKKDKDEESEEDDDMAGDEAPQPLFGEDPNKLQPRPETEEDTEDKKNGRSDERNKEIERKIVELRQFAEEIKLRQVFKQIAAQDSYFGISHLFIDLKGANVEDPRDPENRMDIGDGRNEVSKAKLSKNCLQGLRTIEPVWCYPTLYNAVNPLHPSWYDPQVWYVMGSEIHKSRLIPFIGRPVPDILKPAYAFGGLPMIQMAQPYVDIWLRTRESVSELIHAFSMMILQTNMGTTIQPGGSGGGAGDVIARMMMLNALRDNQGMLIIDKATEDFKNVSAPLGTLDALQAQAQEHMYSIARIPAVKWTGIQPQGLNATSEGELRAFNDTVHGYQEQLFRVGLTTIVDIMMISLWGKRDEDITFEFNELHEMTEKEKAETGKIKAETDQIRVDSGIVSQEEVRAVLVSDPDSGFHGLDPDDVPELLEEEQAGLIPEGAGKGLEAELAQGGAGGPGGPQKPPPPFSGPPKPKKPPPFGKGGADQAMDSATDMASLRGGFEAAKSHDTLGYLDGLNQIEVIPDKDQWHSQYLYESDTIEVQRKLLTDDDAEKTRTLLHEAGHRAQYRADKATYRAFEKAGLGTTENFVAMANAVHLHDFRCKGHVDDRVGEVFSESYAHWCLGMEMPIALREFWEGRSSRGGMAQDADWEESKHPRDKGGKFSSGGGGGGAAAKPKASHHGGPNATPQKPFAKVDLSTLEKTSGKMGSNEGGTYTGLDGQKYYVKKPKTAAHVKNENTAARLYQLTGANTLEYMDAGPNHVATKLEKLDKNNIKQLSPEERKAAQKDFVTHAWLGNWDAAGLGGDNQGVLNGKVTTLDVGGSLEYRAQGEPKGDAFGNNVSEVFTLMDAKKNPDTAALFGDMTDEQFQESAKQVTQIPNNAIREVVEAGGGSPELAEKLIARKNDLAKTFGQEPAGDTNPEWEALHPRGPGGKFAAKPGGEEETDFDVAKNFEDFEQKMVDANDFGGPEAMIAVAAANPEFAEKALKKTNNPKMQHYLQKGIDKAMAAGGEEEGVAEIDKMFAKLKAESAPKKAFEPKPAGAFKSKKELIGHLLSNPEGVTMAEVLKQTGWPSVSMPAQAAAAGMKLEKKKVGGETKYFGTPMTGAEKVDLKDAAKAKLQAKGAAPVAAPTPPAAPAKPAEKPAAPAAPKVPGPPQAYPPPTEAELSKAKKAQPLQMNYIPGEKPTIAGGEYEKKAQELLSEFNKEYSGKDLTSKEDLTNKVNAFKTLGKQMAALKAQEDVNKEAIQKKATEEAKKKADEAKAAAKKKAEEEKAAHAAKYAEVTKELGITHPDHLQAFDAFIDHFGGTKAALDKFKSWQTKAQNAAKNHPGLGFERLNGFEMGCISAYTGPQSGWINKSIVDDAQTPAQHMFEQVLNSALDKLPKVKDKVVRRGLSLDEKVHAKLKPGMVWTHRNFASSSASGWGGNTKLHISTTGKGGAYVAPISSHQHEGETLFKSNLKLYIDKVENIGGVLHVHCKEV